MAACSEGIMVPITVMGAFAGIQKNVGRCCINNGTMSCTRAPIMSEFLSNIHAGAAALCRDMADNMAIYILADATSMMLLGYILDDVDAEVMHCMTF